jgi:hypothetical protein
MLSFFTLALKWSRPHGQSHHRGGINWLRRGRALGYVNLWRRVLTILDLLLYALEQHQQLSAFVVSLRLEALFLEILRCVADTIRHEGESEKDVSPEEGLVY